MDATRHADRVALVTGAGSGIGRATALRLAREGARVVATDVIAERLATLAEEARAEGLELVTAAGDIGTQEGVDAAVAAALDAYGRIDVLANVAGIMDWFLPAHELDDETWRHVLAVNVDGPMMLCRAVLPGMMERRDGAIVNVGSVASLGGGAAGLAYTASKHALIGLTRSIAWTYQTEGVRCNVVCPGGVETDIGTTAVPRSAWGIGRLAKIHALAERSAQPDELAALISWLASAEASNVNGAIVAADGGWLAG